MLNACKRLLKKLNDNGYEAYMVGGFVRDFFLKIPYDDIDVATNALPEEVMKLFNCVPIGIDFGTVLVKFEGFNFEVTTYRIDGNYLDNRHPLNVSFTANLKDDLVRRDFTINALAIDRNMNVVDACNSIDDLNNKIIRSINNPLDRFKEDSLRILRAFHFVSKLGFDIEEKTFKSMILLQDLLKNIKIERIQNELLKIVNGKYRSKAFLLMKKLDILKEYYKLNFNYEVDDLIDLYIYSFYNIEIPDIYHFSKKEKKILKDAKNILSNFNMYDPYMHYLYQETYERCVKIYNKINKKSIKIDKLVINNLKELNINSDILFSNNIPRKFHSKILNELIKEVLVKKINNDELVLRIRAISIYNDLGVIDDEINRLR